MTLIVCRIYSVISTVYSLFAAVELLPKRGFPIWLSPVMLNLKVLSFGSRIFVIVLIYVSIQNSSKSDDTSLKYGDIVIFVMAIVRQLGFLKFEIFTLPGYCRKRCFSIWRTSAILNC